MPVLWRTDNYIVTQTTWNESKVLEQILYNKDIIQES